MAKAARKKTAKKAAAKPGKPASKATTKKPKKAAKPKISLSAKQSRQQKRKTHGTPAEALAGLLESPLVAEVIAAGAAAALATLTQQALSKKAQGGTATALKYAAKAAATAMGTRLATEFDEIVKGSNDPKRGSS